MNPVRRLIQYVRTTSSASSERETTYDGLLSWSGEWHVVEVGLPAGVLTGLTLLYAPALTEPVLGLVVGIAVEALRRGAPSDELSIPRSLLLHVRVELPYYLGSWLLGVAPFAMGRWLTFKNIGLLKSSVVDTNGLLHTGRVFCWLDVPVYAGIYTRLVIADSQNPQFNYTNPKSCKITRVSPARR